MKTTLLSVLALGASTASAFPSTLHHAHLHTHAPKRDTANATWSDNGSRSYGIAYDLMETSGCRTPDQIYSEVAQLAASGYTQVRTYDVGCSVDVLADAISQHPGMQLFAGINSIANLNGDLTKLINMLSGHWNVVDTINICNECVNSGSASAGAVAAAVAQGRGMLQGAGYSGPVVTVDTFVAHLANPSLCAASDYCAANIYAYFDGNVVAENAGDFVKRMQTAVAGIANGKPVRVTESGWPHCGGGNGAAVAGYSQQQNAMASIKQAFANDQSDLFVFQAFNALYKDPGAGGVETCFGILGDN